MLRISRKSAAHLALFAVVLGIMAFNASILYRTQDRIQEEKEVAKEAAKPAELELVILSAPDCKECFLVDNFLASIKANPQVKIAKEDSFDYRSDQGVELIRKYEIAKVPTVLIRGEVGKAFDEASFVENLGKKAEDGTLTVTNLPAPYVEVASGAVQGRFTATYLGDKSCAECYDVSLHRRALAGLSMAPTEEKFVDRAEEAGRKLLAQYKIVSVPTLLLSGDLGAYAQFQQVWQQVGTVEKDGTHIFRAGQQLMGAYKDLKTGKVVKPPPPPEQQQPQPTQ